MAAKTRTIRMSSPENKTYVALWVTGVGGGGAGVAGLGVKGAGFTELGVKGARVTGLGVKGDGVTGTGVSGAGVTEAGVGRPPVLVRVPSTHDIASVATVSITTVTTSLLLYEQMYNSP